MIRKLMLKDKWLEVETLDLCTMMEKFKVDWSNDIDTSESKDKQWVSEVKIYPDPDHTLKSRLKRQRLSRLEKLHIYDLVMIRGIPRKTVALVFQLSATTIRNIIRKIENEFISKTDMKPSTKRNLMFSRKCEIWYRLSSARVQHQRY